MVIASETSGLFRGEGKTHSTLLYATVNNSLRFCVEEENEIALNVGDKVEIHTHYQAKYNLGMPSFMLKCPKWHAKENFNDVACEKDRK